MTKLILFVKLKINRFKDYRTIIPKILFGDFVLIYQMGKVGSATIVESLMQYHINAWHRHYFSKNAFHYFLNDNIKKTSHTKDPIIKLCFKMRKKKLKIITLMRDPVARNLSMVFHELHNLLQVHLGKNSKDRASSDLDDLLYLFIDKYLYSDAVKDWFDNELKYYTGIDIFEKPFIKKNGYVKTYTDKYDVLVLTVEKLYSNKDTIKEFVGLDEFEFKITNIGNKKWYSKIYEDYKKIYVPNKEQIKYYDSPVVKYFYCDSDIKKFKEKWKQ